MEDAHRIPGTPDEPSPADNDASSGAVGGERGHGGASVSPAVGGAQRAGGSQSMAGASDEEGTAPRSGQPRREESLEERRARAGRKAEQRKVRMLRRQLGHLNHLSDSQFVSSLRAAGGRVGAARESLLRLAAAAETTAGSTGGEL